MGSWGAARTSIRAFARHLLQDLNEPSGRRWSAAGTPLVPPRSILLPVASHDRAVRPDLVDDLRQTEMVDRSPDVRGVLAGRDRKSVEWGNGVSVRVMLGGGGRTKKN